MTLYRPTHFRVDDEAQLLAFIERHAFGTLVCDGADGLDVSHIPFLPRRDGDGRIRLLGHVARANPQWQALQQARSVVAIFHGPHAYVSPSWYANHPSVPTWNYSVVHAHGTVRPLEDSALRELLAELSRTYEGDRPGAWRMDSLPEDYLAKMMRAIVGFEMQVERLEGKFKLSQNRPEEIGRVVAALESKGEGDIAEMMRAHAPKPRSTIES
jgi:transcriptional regulator